MTPEPEMPAPKRKVIRLATIDVFVPIDRDAETIAKLIKHLEKCEEDAIAFGVDDWALAALAPWPGITILLRKDTPTDIKMQRRHGPDTAWQEAKAKAKADHAKRTAAKDWDDGGELL